MLYPRVTPLATPKPYRNPSRLFGHPDHPIKDIRNDNRDFAPLGSCAIVCRVSSDLGQGLLQLIKLSLTGTPLSLALQIRIWVRILVWKCWKDLWVSVEHVWMGEVPLGDCDCDGRREG